MNRLLTSTAVVALAISFGNCQATAQEAPPPAEATTLPEVEVIQTPAQKAARAKKKAVPVSPLTSATPAPQPAPPSPGAAPDTAAPTDATDAATSLPTIPSSVTTVTDTDIDREGTMQIQQALQQQVPGVIISDAAGNPLRAEVSYRGFDASPVSGRSQGLAVYQNGVRINEAFGDTVNWDFIPTNAIAATSIVSNNPSFGLNAVGGAVSILMKDGFSYEGGEIDIMGGSFGRAQIGVQAGGSSGNAGIYVAAEGIKDDGFRDFSDSEVKRFYGDIGLKGSMAEVHFSLTAARNHFGATAAVPIELLQQDYSSTFTSPQTTDNELLMPTISGSLRATDTLTLNGVAYYRRYKNNVVDGNVTEIEECDNTADTLCLEPGPGEEVVTDIFGVPIPDDAADEPFGTIDRLDTRSRSWGGVIEGVEKAKLFNMPNLFVTGVSYDHGKSNYKTSSELGTVGPKFVVEGSGVIIGGPDEIAPRNLDTENTYVGLYFSNALDVTDALTLTVGGRYNYARIKLTDLTGDFDGLNATSTYERFNPQIGANYKLLPGISLYGGYSESNRAPTPAELGCAEPTNPCLIESFLTDDPPLDQVIGRTAEIGLRGQSYSWGDRFTWSAGLFRTLAKDDILPVVTDLGTGSRIFFTNAGDTLRQGVELAAKYEAARWSVYGSYAFVDATLDKCTEPDEEGECAFLVEGDRLPGVPRHRFKAGFDYLITPQWRFGADLVTASNQPFFENEGSREEGLSANLAGYTRVDLHTSYDITDNIQVYGLVKNLFDKKYNLYGTFFEVDEVSPVSVDVGSGPLTDPRTVTPALPFAAYGGVKMKF